ncbi:hypothetical protein [Caldifermentibacillus hisashii]|uniref:hypothetical protein n=1 Tax=Caldifermentibacillus hisashii TaxID=996558 RepID=UPI0022B99697|nr:hypothetical protein [Caldifermentibacillus hisashii]
MKETLGTFMLIAATVLVIVAFVFGISFNSLADKNSQHEEVMKTQHQIQFKN